MSSPTVTDPTPPEDDDKQLLISEPAEEMEEEDDEEENCVPTESPCQPMPCNGQYHLSSLQRPKSSYVHMWLVILTLVVATIATVSFPPYLDAINAKSDVYCALMFSSLCTLVTFICALTFVKVRSRDWGVQPPIPWGKVLKLGFHLGLSGVTIFYARDRNRVLCHLQDPLAAAVLPIAVVSHFFISPRVDNTRKLFCLAAIIIGLFVCIDFQIWDEFTCHGHASNDMAEEGVRPWTSEENAIWTIVYLGGLALFALFMSFLEKEMKGDKPECLVATIALTPTTPVTPAFPETVSDDLNEVLIQPQESVYEAKHATPYVSRRRTAELFHKHQVLVLTTWIQFASFCTILLFSWTDLFSFLGKAGSTPAFNANMREGILCHFSSSPECQGVAAAAWPFIIFSSLLVVSIVYLTNYSGTCSTPYLVAIITTALPLSAFCWSFFKTDGGLHWDPSFTGETGFTVVGLPIMAVALGFYRYYASRENYIKM